MVRLTEIIALVSVAAIAGVGGFKIREFFGNLKGENLIPEIPPIPNLFNGGGGFKLPSFDDLNPFKDNDRPPVVIGTPEYRPPPSDLVPTPEEREEGNKAIIDKLGLAPVGPFDRPLFLDQLTTDPLVSQINSVPESVPPTGGGIYDTPIRDLNLSQIVDKFNVTASQAVNIKAESTQDFGDFDFGTNTGRGIGSILSDPINESQLSIGNVSDPRFTGLTPTEIAQRLTGGNISNF